MVGVGVAAGYLRYSRLAPCGKGAAISATVVHSRHSTGRSGVLRHGKAQLGLVWLSSEAVESVRVAEWQRRRMGA